MDIDNIIDAVNDAVEILKVYREMLETGNCNTCKVERSCQYCPEKGELVRVNCPLYVKPEGGCGQGNHSREKRGGAADGGTT